MRPETLGSGWGVSGGWFVRRYPGRGKGAETPPRECLRTWMDHVKDQESGEEELPLRDPVTWAGPGTCRNPKRRVIAQNAQVTAATEGRHTRRGRKPQMLASGFTGHCNEAPPEGPKIRRLAKFETNGGSPIPPAGRTATGVPAWWNVVGCVDTWTHGGAECVDWKCAFEEEFERSSYVRAKELEYRDRQETPRR